VKVIIILVQIGKAKMRTEDGYLIQQCLDGDHTAFGFLVDKYKKSVYASAFSRICNFHDAQDITQEVFIKTTVVVFRSSTQPTNL